MQHQHPHVSAVCYVLCVNVLCVTCCALTCCALTCCVLRAVCQVGAGCFHRRRTPNLLSLPLGCGVIQTLTANLVTVCPTVCPALGTRRKSDLTARTVARLTPDAPYEFRVRAWNAKGYSG